MLELAGYTLALFMGITLGLIGAGGSILTVPILVYFLEVQPVTATGYSLFIVGITALIGAWRNSLLGLVNIRSAAVFALPAMCTVLFTRAYIVPALPHTIILGGVSLSKDHFIMVLFSLLMLLAARFMLRTPHTSHVSASSTSPMRIVKLTVGSSGVGLLTGLVGAGGGFLIVPTLVGLFRLSMKEAVGTSLAVIAINSLVGFKGDISAGIVLDWPLLAKFLLLTSAGMWAGTAFAHKADMRTLRTVFGWFLVSVACGVLLHTLYKMQDSF